MMKMFMKVWKLKSFWNIHYSAFKLSYSIKKKLKIEYLKIEKVNYFEIVHTTRTQYKNVENEKKNYQNCSIFEDVWPSKLVNFENGESAPLNTGIPYRRRFFKFFLYNSFKHYESDLQTKFQLIWINIMICIYDNFSLTSAKVLRMTR